MFAKIFYTIALYGVFVLGSFFLKYDNSIRMLFERNHVYGLPIIFLLSLIYPLINIKIWFNRFSFKNDPQKIHNIVSLMLFFLYMLAIFTYLVIVYYFD